MPDKMRIEELSYPNDLDRKSETVTSGIALIRPRHFIWLAVLAVLGIGMVLFGTPHLRYIYTYTNGYDGQPVYLTCDYIGWHSQRFIPGDGRCPLIKLLKYPQEER